MRVAFVVNPLAEGEQSPNDTVAYDLTYDPDAMEAPAAVGALVRGIFQVILDQILEELLADQPMGNLEVLTQIATAEAKNLLVHEAIHATPLR